MKNRLADILEDTFKDTTSLVNVDLSNNVIKRIDASNFESAENLKQLNISSNRFSEIPANLFLRAVQIEMVDLSKNSIQCVDPTTFENATNIKALNLSYNEIKALDAHCFSTAHRLSTLDLSHNNLTHLNQHIFDRVINLEYLDLSFNVVGNLNIAIFAYLSKLKSLFLKNSNIDNVQPGMFLHQHELVSLDLSANKLKKIDFKLVFLPILHNLQSLNLSGNQLTELNCFEDDSVPELTTLDIRNNRFNCSYLKNLIITIAWDKFQKTNDPLMTHVNIGGIHCTPFETNETQQHEHCSGKLSSLPLCIFVVLGTVLFAIIVIVGRKRLFNLNSGDPQGEYIDRELL